MNFRTFRLLNAKNGGRVLVVEKADNHIFTINKEKVKFVRAGARKVARLNPGEKLEVFKKPNASVFGKEIRKINSKRLYLGVTEAIDYDKLLFEMSEYEGVY